MDCQYILASNLKKKSKTLSRAIIGTALLGILVSTYALYVEMAAEANPEYKALCDLSEYASCSRVLTSEYSKGFGVVPKETPLFIPNCIYGVVFYCSQIFLATYDNMHLMTLQRALAMASVTTSICLAYVLAFVLRDFCLVCVSTYFINGVILFLTYKKIDAFEYVENYNKKDN